jgi:hypothetical protein
MDIQTALAELWALGAAAKAARHARITIRLARRRSERLAAVRAAQTAGRRAAERAAAQAAAQRAARAEAQRTPEQRAELLEARRIDQRNARRAAWEATHNERVHPQRGMRRFIDRDEAIATTHRCLCCGNPYVGTRIACEPCLGLAMRADAGDTEALAQLRAMAYPD